MRAIFGVFGFALFGFIGMFAGGLVEPYITNQYTFTNPDDAAQVTLMANIGTALAFAVFGAVVGALIGGLLKHRVIRKEV